jgi:hypothetical protein
MVRVFRIYCEESAHHSFAFETALAEPAAVATP